MSKLYWKEKSIIKSLGYFVLNIGIDERWKEHYRICQIPTELGFRSSEAWIVLNLPGIDVRRKVIETAMEKILLVDSTKQKEGTY